MAYVRSMKQQTDRHTNCPSTFCCEITKPTIQNCNNNNNIDDDTASDDSWYICDDDDITLVSMTDFEAKIKNEATARTPYILFYVRNDVLVTQSSA